MACPVDLSQISHDTGKTGGWLLGDFWEPSCIKLSLHLFESLTASRSPLANLSEDAIGSIARMKSVTGLGSQDQSG